MLDRIVRARGQPVGQPGTDQRVGAEQLEFPTQAAVIDLLVDGLVEVRAGAHRWFPFLR